jgi:hypothetical protein
MTHSDPHEAMREVAREVLRELMPATARDALGKPAPNGHGGGESHHRAPAPPRHPDPGEHGEIVPIVPAPPVAAVLRPSTWEGPAVPGEVIGGRAPAPATDPASAPAPPSTPAPASDRPASSRAAPPPSARASTPAPAGESDSGARVEPVTIDTDEDLDRFVRTLLARLENPRDRRAIRAGRLRFALRRAAASRSEAATGPGGARTATVRVGKGAVTERAVRDAAAQGVGLMLPRGAVLTPLARDQARALGVEIEREAKC